eukprot:6207841-Pleurochrysis_carterae.AAC.1
MYSLPCSHRASYQTLNFGAGASLVNSLRMRDTEDVLSLHKHATFIQQVLKIQQPSTAGMLLFWRRGRVLQAYVRVQNR